MKENTQKRPSFRAALAGALLVAAAASPLASQETEGPLSPAGRIRLEAQPVFTGWSRRFVETGTEPLGADLTDPTGARLFPGLTDLQERIGQLLDEPTWVARAGAGRGEVFASRVRVPLRLDLGIVDRVTVGVTVPLVLNRTEVAFAFRADTATANLGVNPAVTRAPDVLAFTDDLRQRAGAAAERAAQICGAEPGSVECAAAAQVASAGESLLHGFLSAYSASPFFPLATSPAAEGLGSRVAAFNQGLEALDLSPLATAPLFPDARVSQADFDRLLSEGAVGINTGPLGNRVGLWELGDVEVHAAMRLLEGARAGAPGEPPRFQYQLGGGLLVRLGTGNVDDPDTPLDLPAGDGQTDIEGRLFSNLRSGRFGLWSDARYGVQRPRTLVRRVGPPDLVLTPALNRATVEWDPGDYLQLELVPRYHFTDELALTLGYRLFTKGQDGFRRISPAPEPPDQAPLPSPPLFTDVDLLALETDEALHELGGGLVFSTLEAWRAGRTGLPFEARLVFRWGVAGSGRSPAGMRVAVGLRVFHRLWGS